MKKLFLIVVSIVISGCASIPSIGAPAQPKLVQALHQTNTTTPVVLGVDPKTGLGVVANKVEQTYDYNLQKTEPPVTIGQRIGSFFAHLSFWGLLFVVLSLLLAGGAPIVAIYRRYLTAKNALVNTIEAIQRMKAEDKEKLKPLLLQEQDEKDQTYIKRLKATEVSPQGPPAPA